MRILLVLSAVFLGLVACGDGSSGAGLFGGGGAAGGTTAGPGGPPGCVPGHQVPCSCQWDASDGVQVCAPDGASYGPCEGCSGAPVGAGGGGAGQAGSSGLGGTGGGPGGSGGSAGKGGAGGDGGAGGGGTGGQGGAACVPKITCEGDLNICDTNNDGCNNMIYCGPCGGDGSLICNGRDPSRCICIGPIPDPDDIYPFICSQSPDTAAMCQANSCKGYECGGKPPLAKAPPNCGYAGYITTAAGSFHAWCCY
jgi:hypothetical protein